MPFKRVLKGDNKLKHKFSDIVFPNFWPLGSGILIFEPKIGFYVKFPPWNRLERFRIWNPGPKMGLGPFKRGLRDLRGLRGL